MSKLNHIVLTDAQIKQLCSFNDILAIRDRLAKLYRNPPTRIKWWGVCYHADTSYFIRWCAEQGLLDTFKYYSGNPIYCIKPIVPWMSPDQAYRSVNNLWFAWRGYRRRALVVHLLAIINGALAHYE